MYTCIYIYVYVYMYIYIHMYIYHIYMCLCVCVHIYIQMLCRKLDHGIVGCCVGVLLLASFGV